MSNRTDFVDHIVQWAEKDPQRIDLDAAEMYAFDINETHHTSFSADAEMKGKSFTLINQDPPITVTHICVDGGLIEWGKEDYVGDGVIRGRNDCLLITDEQLILVELKTDLTSEEDKNIWKNFSKGMCQLCDFYIYMRDRLFLEGRPISSFFVSPENTNAFVCIHPYPKLPSASRKIASTQRMTEIERFRTKTNGVKVFPAISYRLGTVPTLP